MNAFDESGRMMASVAPGQWSKLLLTIAGDTRHAGRLPGPDNANLTAQRKIDHRHIIGSRVGHVRPRALRIQIDKVGPPLHRNGSSDGVAFRVDYRDRAAARVDGIHLIAMRVDR
jgi:hypothetical protein